MKKVFFTITLLCMLIFGGAITSYGATHFSEDFFVTSFSGNIVTTTLDENAAIFSNISFMPQYYQGDSSNQKLSDDAYIHFYNQNYVKNLVGKKLVFGVAYRTESTSLSNYFLNNSAYRFIFGTLATDGSYAWLEYAYPTKVYENISFPLQPRTRYNLVIYECDISSSYSYYNNTLDYTIFWHPYISPYPSAYYYDAEGGYYALNYDMVFCNIIDSYTMEDFYTNLTYQVYFANEYLADIDTKIDNIDISALNATDPAQQAEMNDAQDSAKQAYEEANDYTKPDVGEVSDDVDTVLNDVDISYFSAGIAPLFGTGSIITRILLIAAALALISYIFFGKKG